MHNEVSNIIKNKFVKTWVVAWSNWELLSLSHGFLKVAIVSSYHSLPVINKRYFHVTNTT